MNAINTATVETLTAEVRVLMVGSRQITMSVARQLDTVDLMAMIPLGRINLGYGLHYVIGRHGASGSLVTADYRQGAPHPGQRAYIGRGDLTARVRACQHCIQHVRNRGPVRLEIDGQNVDFDDDLVVFVPCVDHGGHTSITLSLNGQENAIRQVVHDHNFKVLHYKDAEEMPLIVLAGLR